MSQCQSTAWFPSSIIPIKIKACGHLWHRHSKPLRIQHCQRRSLWSTSSGMRLLSETERWGTVPPRSHKWNDCLSSYQKSRHFPITTGRTFQEPTEEIQSTQWKPPSGMNHGLFQIFQILFKIIPQTKTIVVWWLLLANKTLCLLSILGCAKDPDETWCLPLATKKVLFGQNRIAVGGRPEVEASATSAPAEPINLS